MNMVVLATIVRAQLPPYEVIKFEHREFDDYQDVLSIRQDPRGFIWIATQDRGLFRYDGYDLISYRSRSGGGRSISSDLVLSSQLNESGDTLWVGTAGANYQFIDLKRNRVQIIPGPEKEERATWIYDIKIDSKGTQWLATGDGLWSFRLSDTTWEKIMTFSNRGPVTLVDIAQISENTIITGGLGENIYQVDMWSQSVLRIEKSSLGIAGKEVRSLTFYKGRLWVGTDAGVFQGKVGQKMTLTPFVLPEVGPLTGIDLLFNTSSGMIIGSDEGTFLLDDQHNLITSFPSIKNAQCALISKDDQIWIGTLTNGLYKLRPKLKPFKTVNRDISIDNFSNNNIHGFWEDEAGLIWFGTAEGLQIFDREDNKLLNLNQFLEKSHPLRNIYVASIQEDSRGIVWIGTRSNGVFRAGPGHSTSRLARIRHHNLDESDIARRRFANTTAHIEEVRDHQMWIGSFNSGLHLFSGEGEEMARILHDPNRENSLPANAIGALHFDSTTDYLYVGTLGGGLARSKLENLADPQFETFQNTPDTTSISNNSIMSIMEDGDSVLWIGTYGGGLNRMDLRSKTFKAFNDQNGFPDNVVIGTLIDNEGYLWIGTTNGLIKFDRKTNEVVHVFNQMDGLSSDEFTYFSTYKTKDGILCLGSKNGFTHFDPAAIEVNRFDPKAVLTDLKVLNKPVAISDSTILYEHISFLPDLTFSHRENAFTITFSSDSYFQPIENQFRFMLEGLDEEWVTVQSDQRYTTYTNLRPGDYKFLVSCSNDDGIWSSKPTALNISVLPAPWETWWAKLSYLLVLLVIGYLIFRSIRNRIRLKTNLAIQKAESQRLKEVDEFKNRFFTGITHEFRTPLTIISGMTKSLQSQSNSSLGKIENLVQKNTETLLRLVNQMLDLAKAESGVLKTTPRLGNIVVYIRSQLEVFKESAKARGQTIEFVADREEILMDFDASSITTILHNLISNAIKFGGSDSTIKIQLSADKEEFTLKIEDEGKGIKEADLPHIFDRFYQTEDHIPLGSGIGLSLVKELVELLQGEIHVESIINQGTIFIVSLPITRNAPKATLSTHNLPSPGDQKMAAKRKGKAPLVLIVDDNPDLIFVIRSTLGPEYQILEATNGEEGKILATEQIPDLIITDVMMPKVNGLEMCRLLREDEKTSHIPIIMLTAKITVENRVQGLREGADAYLSKPFNEIELQVRVRNLLKNRENLRARYSVNGLHQDKKNASTTPLQDEFIQKLRSIIESELQNEEMGPSYLCDKLFISRTQLHRKIRAITGLNTTKFISAIRVEKAQELLLTTDKPIEEISYEVGFKNPTYFRRVFKEFTRQSASQYRAGN